MGKSCELPRKAFIKCMASDPCVKEGRRTPKECLLDQSISDACRKLLNSYKFCMKDQLDMRRRLRGPKAY